LESGSDRIGALDFQVSSINHEPRHAMNATLEEVSEAAERVEKGMPLMPALDLCSASWKLHWWCQTQSID